MNTSDIITFLSSTDAHIEQSLRYLIHESFNDNIETYLIDDILSPLLSLTDNFDNEFLLRLVFWVVKNFTAGSGNARKIFSENEMHVKLIEALRQAVQVDLLVICCDAVMNMAQDGLENEYVSFYRTSS